MSASKSRRSGCRPARGLSEIHRPYAFAMDARCINWCSTRIVLPTMRWSPSCWALCRAVCRVWLRVLLLVHDETLVAAGRRRHVHATMRLQLRRRRGSRFQFGICPPVPPLWQTRNIGVSVQESRRHVVSLHAGDSYATLSVSMCGQSTVVFNLLLGHIQARCKLVHESGHDEGEALKSDPRSEP